MSYTYGSPCVSLIPPGYAQYQYKDELTTTAEDHDGV